MSDFSLKSRMACKDGLDPFGLIFTRLGEFNFGGTFHATRLISQRFLAPFQFGLALRVAFCGAFSAAWGS